MRETVWRLLAGLVFALWWSCMVWLTHTVWFTAHEHYIKEQNRTISQGWTPRSIPVCDKELWERIREGCDDE